MVSRALKATLVTSELLLAASSVVVALALAYHSEFVAVSSRSYVGDDLVQTHTRWQENRVGAVYDMIFVAAIPVTGLGTALFHTVRNEPTGLLVLVSSAFCGLLFGAVFLLSVGLGVILAALLLALAALCGTAWDYRRLLVKIAQRA